MIEINLLPWRETKREQDKKEFNLLLAGSFVFAVLVVIIGNYYASSLVESENTRNQVLKNEIVLLDQQIREIKNLEEVKNSLIARMMIISSLQAERTLTVHLFDELIKILPDGVYLTDIKRIQNKVIVQGYAESNSNVSILMRQIQQNPWIQEPELTEIKKKKEVQQNNNGFILSFILKPKSPAAKT